MTEAKLDPTSAEQRRALWIVLAINIGLTLGFAIAGWIGDSSTLLANSVDSASDSFVFVITLLAINRSGRWKRGAARISAATLLLVAVGVIGDTVRRGIYGSEPIGPTILIMGVIGAVGNVISLWLLMRLRSKDVNMRAATTFSLNDFASNGGIFIAGGLVMWTGSNWPDLVMGGIVAAVALYGGFDILRDAHRDAAKKEPG